MLASLYAGLLVPPMPDAWQDFARSIAVSAVLVQVAIWASHAVLFWTERYRALRMEVDASSVGTVSAIGLFARIGIWVVVAVLLLDNVGIRITAIVAGLGIGGIAIALAAQSILGDLFSSLSIVLDKPFVVGDFIIVGSEMGVVEHVGLKTTRVRSLSGEQLIFSNADILQSRIRNYGRMAERRVVFTLGVTYQTSPTALAAIPDLLQEIVQRQADTRFDRAHFARYADSALEFEVVYYVLSAEHNHHMDIQQHINLDIFRAFADAGVDFAYPTRTLFIQSSGSASGDMRSRERTTSESEASESLPLPS